MSSAENEMIKIITMKTEKLKTGDLVKLKSGSPLMTVFSDKEYDFITNGFLYQYKEDLVICAWFDEHGLCYKYVFHTQSLNKIVSKND